MAADLRRIEEVFHVAMTVAPGGRGDYLDSACEEDQALRREVESLVAAYETGGHLLDDSAVTLAFKVLASSADDSMVGQTVGPYRVLNVLGHGGMGSVYLAEDTRLDRKVALKFLSGNFVMDNWAKRQLIKEAQAVARLDHPNICAVYGLDEIGEHSFIVMQYIEGQTIAEMIRSRAIAIDQMISLAHQIVSALGAAHAHGIIHRDIKPKNIMVTPNGQIKVLDFGLAKTVPKTLDEPTESVGRLSGDGLLMGTVAYMSPEQLRAEKLDYRSDIFSLGTVLYEMVSGNNPFIRAEVRQGRSNAEVISAIMTDEPISLRQAAAHCPKDFDRLVSKCLNKDRANRYQSAAELLFDLDNLQKGLALPHRFASFLNIRYASIAAMLMLVAVVGIFIYSAARNSAQTLAVLPITCYEATPNAQCVDPNFTDGLIKTLSKRKGVRVISSLAEPSPGLQAVGPKRVGQDLDADMVMSGHVSRGELGPMLTIRVERVSDGSRIWEKSYLLNPDKASTLQRRISLEAAVELQLPTNEDDKALVELIAANDNHSTEAYTLYLQGRKKWFLRDGENIKGAIEDFRRATELDPSYAEAYAGLADCYVLLPTVAYGSVALTSKDAMIRAEWAAKQALNYGNDLAESHNAHGSVLLKGQWDWDNAEKEFLKAIALNPDYQPAHFNYSTLLQMTGRAPEALQQSELAMNQDPFSGAAIMNHCRALYVARQFNQADACLDRLAVDRPDYAGGKYLHGIVYDALGRITEATQIFEDIYAKDKAYGGAALGYTYGIGGRRADAERILNEMLEYQKQHYLPDQEIGIIYLGMNDLDHAFPLMRKAVEDKFPPAQSFFFSPSFDRLRADPRFPELAREVKLPYYPPNPPAAVSNTAK